MKVANADATASAMTLAVKSPMGCRGDVVRWVTLAGIVACAFLPTAFCVGCRRPAPSTETLTAAIVRAESPTGSKLAMDVAHEHLRQRRLTREESESLVSAVLPHLVEDGRVSGMACLLLRLCRPDDRVARRLSEILDDESMQFAAPLTEVLFVHGSPANIEATCRLYARQQDRQFRRRLISSLWVWGVSDSDRGAEALRALRSKETDVELIAVLDDVIEQVETQRASRAK